MILPSLLVLALASTAAPGDVALARVDAVEITRADLDERLRVLRSRRVPKAPRAALGDLVEEALLAAEARRMGADKDPAVAAQIAAERTRLAGEALAAKMTPEPSEAALRELYHQTSDSARLILVKVANEEEARAVLERAKKGGDLAAEARRSVDKALAARGGDTGLVSRAALDPALADAAFAAKPGALLGPVQLRLGWAVARLLELRVADEGGFAARRESIAAFARDQLRSQARSHVLEQLKKKAGVKLDEEFLRNVGKSGDPTEKELDHAIAVVNGRPLPYRVVHSRFERAIGGRGHGASAARIAFAWSEIEKRLLEDEAVAQGLDRSPAVARALPGIERNILASAAAARITGKPSADLSDPVLRKRLDALRSGAKVSVDGRALEAIERDAG